MMIFLRNYIIMNILFNTIFSQREYNHYNYDEIMTTFEELSHSCSHYIKIDTSQARYNLDSVEGCGNNKNCSNLIVFLTDFDSYTLDRPAYYISGVLHGDEIIGPPSVTEFAKYFCDTYNIKKNSLYHHILKNKLIIITPMTNAFGYFNGKREEKVFFPKTKEYKYADPNRDFPYFNSNQEIQNCMQTIAARTINEIFNEFIIGGAITFHGGTSVLGYAWGNHVHTYKNNNKLKSTESPDFNAFNKIGQIMVKLSSSQDNLKNKIKDYELGDMTSTVYPLNGALEDWAYGGWENKEYENMGTNLRPIKTCKPESFTPYEMIWNNLNGIDHNSIDYNYKLRCLMYLAEASDEKKPKKNEYGINYYNTDKKVNDIFDFYQTTNFFGHIPRNMRLMYSGIDLVSASIYLDIENIKIKENKDNKQIIIPFLFMGCLSLNKYSIHKITFEQFSKNMVQKNFLDMNINSSTKIYEVNEGINCYYKNLTYYNLIIEMQKNKKNNNKSYLRKNGEKNNNDDPIHYFVRPGGNYDYIGNVLHNYNYTNMFSKYIPKKGSIYFIKGEAPDQDWGNQEDPDPKVGPQSHVVRSKIDSNYFIQNGNYSLKSNYYFYSFPVVVFDNGDIQVIDDIDSFLYEEDLDFMKLIINYNNKNYKISSQISCHKQELTKKNNKNIYSQYLASENIFDINFEMNIFEDKGNLLANALKEKKEIKLFSQMVLNDENENFHQKLLECKYSGDLSLFITCPKILENINAKYIRNNLANSILGFELKIENITILNIFAQISLNEDNKGKYFVDYYSKNDNNENNKMLCTSNFPYFLNISNEKQNEIFYDDIYYEMYISKISTTKFKINIDINQNKYKYFLVFFPFYDKIGIFDIKNKIFEIEVNLNQDANGKIIGKTVYIIPIEDEDYLNSQNITFKTNDLNSLISSLNIISKKKNYKLIPCSIISYNSFKNEKSISEFRKMIEKFTDMKPFIRKKRTIKDIFIFKHIILSSIILSIFLIVIFYIMIKKCRKNKIYYSQFDSVAIADISNSPKTRKY